VGWILEEAGWNAFSTSKNIIMKDFIATLLGNQSASAFAALVFFSLLGAVLSLLLHTTKRDPNSIATPRKFSWIFFIEDNWKRAITSLILIYLALRFTPELFGVQINEFWAIAIGLCNDQLAQFIKDKTNILGQKK
jgi:ABC-type methionine transport system permease subunit